MKQKHIESYQSKSTCIHILFEEDFSALNIIYSYDSKFENIRLQKWLRENIRDAIIERAKIILPKRLHELEDKHNLWAKKVSVKKLRKGVLGQCAGKYISLSPLIVIFPQELMDDVILHELAHLKYHHHRKSFWDFLSTLIGIDAKTQKMLQDIALSKYWDLYSFLMK